jgi:hypothetical protein
VSRVRRLKEDSANSSVLGTDQCQCLDPVAAVAIIRHPFRCARWSFCLRIEEAPCDIGEEKKGSKGEKVQHAVRVTMSRKGEQRASIGRTCPAR